MPRMALPEPDAIQPDLLAGVDRNARRLKPLRRPPPQKGLLICGVDEAGRGPLAGPVYAAAVVLNPAKVIRGLDDSKKLTAARREKLAVKIQTDALAFGIASASVEEIDRINILQATMLAMQRAVHGLRLKPALVRVDGNRLPVLPMAAEAIVQGDATVQAISAASILAKVARDLFCEQMHASHPQWGFATHKGYSTPEHLAALKQHGASPWHRRSFAPVREVCIDVTKNPLA